MSSLTPDDGTVDNLRDNDMIQKAWCRTLRSFHVLRPSLCLASQNKQSRRPTPYAVGYMYIHLSAAPS